MTRITTRSKLWISGAVLAIGALAITVGCYLLLPSGYLAIDLNPSIEIQTNRLGQVTSIRGVNDDAKALLEGYQLHDRDLDDVIEDIVDRMVWQGYLDAEHNPKLLVTAEQGKVKQATLDRVNADIARYLAHRQVTADVVGQSVTLDAALREQAAGQQISAGKMAVIQRLVAQDPTLKPEELRDTSVSDLLAFATEKGVSLNLLEDRLDDLADRFWNDTIAEALEEQLDHWQDTKRYQAPSTNTPTTTYPTTTTNHKQHWDDDDHDYDDWDDHDDHDDWDD